MRLAVLRSWMKKIDKKDLIDMILILRFHSVDGPYGKVFATYSDIAKCVGKSSTYVRDICIEKELSSKKPKSYPIR